MSEQPTIATLTMNPTVDVAYEVDRVRPTVKLRSSREQYDPGGGGLNVARVFHAFGGQSHCVYPCGGPTGVALKALLDRYGLTHQPIPITGDTRVCTNVAERATGKDFRFVAAGPSLAEAEWQACLGSLEDAPGAFLVASGSLPPGAPTDFYARVAQIARRRGQRFVLDASGAALRESLAAGGIYLAKPSLVEFAEALGKPLPDMAAVGAEAMALIEQGLVEILAVTMGEDGALLATRHGPQYLPAMAVEARSTAGAGDSFVAAMVHRLAIGWETFEAFRFGMAAGSAAVLTAGTDMCRPAEVERLYRGN